MDRLPSAQILIIEDEPLVLLDLEDALAQAGARNLVPFSSIDDALAYLENEKPDAAIVDMLMHNQSSAQVVDVLLNAGVPVLVYSGAKPDPKNESERIFVGLNWLSKPASPETIMNALQLAHEVRHPH